MTTIIGFTNITEQVDNLEQRFILHRTICEFTETEALHAVKPLGKRHLVTTDGTEIGNGDPCTERCIPRLDLRSGPAENLFITDIVGMISKPREIERNGF